MSQTIAVDYSVVHAVPGHGKPIQHYPSDNNDPLFLRTPLPSALSTEDLAGAAVMRVTTLREFSMLQFMNAITDKENWHIKILDEEIAGKWKEEAINAARAKLRGQDSREEEEDADEDGHVEIMDRIQGLNTGSGAENEGDEESESEEDGGDGELLAQWPIHFVPRDESMMTSAMAEYCIAELRHRVKEFGQSPHGAIVVYNGDVVKSDVAVPSAIKDALKKAVAPLEEVPPSQKDWHPGSDEKVLDLVHPSLFPLIYGRSKVLAVGEKVTTLEDCIERIGDGNVIPVPPTPEVQRFGRWGRHQLAPYSAKFQWLPCDVDISGTKPKIISYINNLHPSEHTSLYAVIEDVIGAAIPLWEKTLAPVMDEDFEPNQRINYDGPEYDPDPQDIENDCGGPPIEGTDDEDAAWELREDWNNHIRRTVLPEPEDFDASKLTEPEPISFKDLYANKGRPLQIIVKLANIELTPEKPTYDGGSWHVEGKLNEHIVATALYYYSSENITRSSLAFRQVGNSEPMTYVNYEQNVHDFLWDVYGCNNEEGAVQEVGDVETREGRLLTFPNVLQHRVQPFRLEDTTKPGHRKILALFLVDPNIRVLSTAHVPPQQLDWWKGELLNEELLQKLPAELQSLVYSEVEDFPITLADAKTLREELMEERKDFGLLHARAFEESMTFSLCEH